MRLCKRVCVHSCVRVPTTVRYVIIDIFLPIITAIAWLSELAPIPSAVNKLHGVNCMMFELFHIVALTFDIPDTCRI